MEENGYGKSIDHVRDESREYGLRALDMNMKSTKTSCRLQILNPASLIKI